MKYYVVLFDGAVYSNDSGEGPFCAGVYSSSRLAEQEIKNFLVKELKNSDDWLLAEMEEEFKKSIKKISYKNFVSAYEDEFGDLGFHINKYELNDTKIFYSAFYQPNGNKGKMVGLFSSIDEALNASSKIVQKFDKIKNKLSTNEIFNLHIKDYYGEPSDLIITQFSLDKKLFHLWGDAMTYSDQSGYYNYDPKVCTTTNFYILVKAS